MRILYDGEAFRMQPVGGINRYFANVIGRLPITFKPTLLIDKPREIDYPSHPNLKAYQYGRRRLDDISYRLSSRVSLIEDWWHANRRFDLAHPTYYKLVTEKPLSEYRCPIVVTVWDMVHELFSETMDPDGWVA